MSGQILSFSVKIDWPALINFKREMIASFSENEEKGFLEMLDEVNERLIREGKDPIAFYHDCREGICGMCSQVINGEPHGPLRQTTVCQLHMRNFKDGDHIYIEPWRARAFPIIRDLVVDRRAMDALMQAGGYTSAHTGRVPDGNSILVPNDDADLAMDAAVCIACGACVSGCPNASAMLPKFRISLCCLREGPRRPGASGQ